MPDKRTVLDVRTLRDALLPAINVPLAGETSIPAGAEIRQERARLVGFLSTSVVAAPSDPWAAQASVRRVGAATSAVGG